MPLKRVLLTAVVLSSLFGVGLKVSGAAKHQGVVRAWPGDGDPQPPPVCPPRGCQGH